MRQWHAWETFETFWFVELNIQLKITTDFYAPFHIDSFFSTWCIAAFKLGLQKKDSEKRERRREFSKADSTKKMQWDDRIDVFIQKKLLHTIEGVSKSHQSNASIRRIFVLSLWLIRFDVLCSRDCWCMCRGLHAIWCVIHCNTRRTDWQTSRTFFFCCCR